jgi:hypothetical protein
MSMSSSKSILSSACTSLGLSVVAIKKYKHFFHIYLKNDKKTLDENYELLKAQISSKFHILIDWSRDDSETYDKPGGKVMDGKDIHSGFGVVDLETERGSLYLSILR